MDLPGKKSDQLLDEEIRDLVDRLGILHFQRWQQSMQVIPHKWTIKYRDGAMISMSEPTFTVLVGNQEEQFDEFCDAELWLWNNFSSGQL